MSDVNVTPIINNGDDVIENSNDNIYENEKDSTKIDEDDELEESIDRLFRKHVLQQNERSTLNETSNDSHTKVAEKTLASKFDLLYADFSAFKMQVIKEFLFLKHLLETDDKNNCDNNPVNSNLVRENEMLKKENEKLREWIDNLFEITKVNKDKDQECKSNEVKKIIEKENIATVNKNLPPQMNNGSPNQASKNNKETIFKHNDAYHHSVTYRKRPADIQQLANAKKKRTDDALSFSQNFEINDCPSTYITENKNNSSANNNEKRKKIVPGNRLYSEVVDYGKKTVIFGDSHIGRVNRKKLDFNINGKSHIKFFSGVDSYQLKYYVTPTILKEKPDSVIIHVGSNDVNFHNAKYSTPEVIAEKILKCAEESKSLGVEDVAISSVLIKNF